MEKWFALLKECGISGVMFEGYNENIYRLCKSRTGGTLLEMDNEPQGTAGQASRLVCREP